ncbi:hypothetical protein ACFY1L_07705 [Streptomyces sp. NPDC001663]|uniref:hypothetical protein n=1 Tax=Streptomyces sp. NPDC001663 TaxID=3364597 RepID=UPI0036B338E0
MSDPAAALALSAATTLVNTMATSGWEATKALFVRLFRRQGDGDEPAAELERAAARVVAAGEGERAERARQSLVGTWQYQLQTLLEDHPDAEAELLEILAGLQSPEAGQHWQQTNIARDGGTTYAAQGGNVIHYSVDQVPPVPDPGDHR